MRAHATLLPVVVLIAASACSSKERAADSTAAAAGVPGSVCVEGGVAPTITAAGVGPLRIGGAVSDIARRCAVRDTSLILSEGITEKGRLVNLGNASAVLLVSDDAEPTIERIIITDSSIRTEDGVGIGKSVGALRAAYGRLCAMRGEGNLVVMVSSLPGVSFAIAGAVPEAADVERQPDAIPDNASIIRIWVHSGRSACGGS